MALWRAATRAADAGFAARNPFYSFAGMSFSLDHCNVTPRRMTCGELRISHVGSLVELAGSVQEKRLGRFLLLRDAYGSTQLVIPDERPDINKRLTNLPLRSFISIIGWVLRRPEGAINETMVTGQVEVSVQDLVMVRVNRNNPIKNDKTTRTKMSNLRSVSVRNFSTSNIGKLLTTEEYRKCKGNENLISLMQNRTETCANLSVDDVGRKITLFGWIHDRRLPRFIKLKDGHGSIQCLIPFSKSELQNILKSIESEDIIQITGVVSARPPSQINSVEESGDIEILVETIAKSDSNISTSIVEEDIDVKIDESSVNSHCWRTHTCGELNITNVGQQVTLCGWLEYCRMGKFFTLRDSYGATQCIIPDEEVEKLAINDIPFESTIEVKGNVGARPTSAINANMETGEIEVVVNSLKVLNLAIFTPFQMRAFKKPKEQLQLLHRYLYLRFPEMQNNLRTRSNMLMKMRKFLADQHQFVEVETPTLFCRTPGGAREFVVPTRHKGQFYSLIQSPQQHKQMLMAGGIDRYFQIARCYRDEMTRGDRQPEFTQLDIEMSFASRENILQLIEGLIRCSWPRPLSSKSFMKLTYREALSKYGTDKPDISYDYNLQDITNELDHSESVKRSTNDFGAFAIVVRQPTVHISNSFKNMATQSAKERYPNVHMICSNVKQSVEQWSTSISFIESSVLRDIAKKLELTTGETLFIAYGDWEQTCWCLGEIRSMLAKEAESKGQLQRTVTEDTPLWVVDFPLFTKGDNNQLETCHHPFTAPHPNDQHLLKTDPLKVRSLAYDLVIAGNEVAGGSVRIHNSELQKEVFKMLKISPTPLEHLLHALECGCPPHAGIALGIDRLVAIACDAESIREVIAFPKTHEGRDPLSGAPSVLTQEEQNLYHIQVPDSIDSAPKRLRTDI